MSETSFSLDDLFRRKLQTSLVVLSLAFSVGSTLFLLLSAERLGLNFSLKVQGTLTEGISSLFSPFIGFLIVLILIAGGVMTSFMVSIMMTQRRRDIGLMRAVGCPNDLVFGYFFNELFIVSLLGCLSGIALGVIADFVNITVFRGSVGQTSAYNVDFRILFATFFGFLVLALVVGAKPIFDTSRIKPAEAISPAYYVGLSKESQSKVLSRSGFSFRVALRGVVRHRSSTVKIVLCLSVIFMIVTVAIAGGIIAEQTTESWIERAVDANVVLVAHRDVCTTYSRLLENFYLGGADSQFNYSGAQYELNESFLEKLQSLAGNAGLDQRLLARTTAQEIQGFVVGETTGQTQTVGDDRQETALVVGIDPNKVVSNWLTKGSFPESDHADETVVGDTLASELFTDTTVEKIQVFGASLAISGVCIDPINNGRLVYVPLKTLETLTGASGPNLALIRIAQSADKQDFLSRLDAVVSAENSNFAILDLQNIVNQSINFLEYVWQPVLLLPLLSLVSASSVLIGFVVLAIDEQRQEFGILRAVGARPGTIINFVSLQNMLVTLPSYGMGVAFGIIVIQIILIENPVVTVGAVLEIAGFLSFALIATFLSGLYPALRFAHRPLLETIRQR